MEINTIMKDFEIQTFIDGRDKREYQAVKVGKLLVMSQNLACAAFRSGDPIPVAKDALHWEKEGSLSKACMCMYAYDPADNEVLGRFYNQYALNDPRGLAPENWRIPSVDDMLYVISHIEKVNRRITNRVLFNEIDGMDYESIEDPEKRGLGQVLKASLNCNEFGLKETPAIREWNGTARSFENPLNFSALPAGFCDHRGIFCEFGESAAWWTVADDGNCHHFLVNYESLRLSHLTYNTNGFGFNARCVRDF